MTTYIHKCERCGKEKEILLADGESPEEIGCGCGKKKRNTEGSGYIGIESISIAKESHQCGCGGGHCGSN